jgi:GNAT superfamily N-acetyltransferase
VIFREAQIKDIPPIQIIRNAVRENTLSDPALVTDLHCAEFMFERGKGWVCEIDHQVVGFAIVDLRENNVWALFVHPDLEGRGVGRQLHDTMLEWYFSQSKKNVWLGTAPFTRAANFYRHLGWIEIGTHGKGEIKFEMSYKNWLSIPKDL